MNPSAANRSESRRLLEVIERRRELGQPFDMLTVVRAFLDALADAQDAREAVQAQRDERQLDLGL